MKTIYPWKEWEKNWNNAYKFFNSKGNTKTKSRLKKKWQDDFMDMLERIS